MLIKCMNFETIVTIPSYMIVYNMEMIMKKQMMKWFGF